MSNNSIYVCNTCDVHHSYSSFQPFYYATSLDGAISAIKEWAKAKGEPLNDDDDFNLAEIRQTQGYEGECAGEFYIEEIELNVFINGMT
jgi:hypothetical protein